MVTVTCQLCGCKYDAQRKDAKYCALCRVVKHREYGQKTDAKRKIGGRCIDCGKPIHRGSGIRHRCRSCSRKGPLSVLWKGGKHKDRRGYVYIYMPEHPRAGRFHNIYVAEHQLVWEKAHSMLLPDNHIVHHLNGIKSDNRPENLVAITRKDHSTWTRIRALEARIRELESQLTRVDGHS